MEKLLKFHMLVSKEEMTGGLVRRAMPASQEVVHGDLPGLIETSTGA